jgi:hypothetical protein
VRDGLSRNFAAKPYLDFRNLRSEVHEELIFTANVLPVAADRPKGPGRPSPPGEFRRESDNADRYDPGDPRDQRTAGSIPGAFTNKIKSLDRNYSTNRKAKIARGNPSGHNLQPSGVWETSRIGTLRGIPGTSALHLLATLASCARSEPVFVASCVTIR